MANWFSARILLAGFILLLATLLVVLVAGNLRRDTREEAAVQSRPDSDLAMRKVNYTETQDGRRKWSIQADSAAHDLKGQVATVENVRMVIYEQGDGDIVVSSQHGRLDMRKGVVSLQGDVTVENINNQSIYTDELEFDNNRKVLQGRGSVRVVSAEVQLTGVGMKYDLDRRMFQLLSTVEATFTGGALPLP